jgi:tetratricopeptide (TPR) repeat protein
MGGIKTKMKRIIDIDKLQETHQRQKKQKTYWLIKLGNYTGAITYLDKALAIDPNYKLALNNKAWALKQLHHS